jgi:hypothetical protein
MKLVLKMIDIYVIIIAINLLRKTNSKNRRKIKPLLQIYAECKYIFLN